MNSKKIIASGYPRAAVRLEHRPLVNLHTREDLIDILDTLQRCGVDAWWYSAAAKGSYPLFPSKHLPWREQEDRELLPWLVEQAHKRGISLMSWEYLNTAPLLAEQHPEWRVRYLDGDERTHPRDDHFVCLNSPYGQLLKDYCVELVNDIGFDGIWFDGCFQYGDRNRRWTCCCDECAARFREATGLEIPTKVEFSDPVFRRFVKWRYDWFYEYWKSLADYVRQRNEKALIGFNFFYRLVHETISGCRLERSPIDALVASEVDCRPNQVILQTKYLRAISDTYPPEVWVGLEDGTRLYGPGRPDPEPAGLISYGQACMTAGGFPSYGVGEDPRQCRNTLKSLSEALRTRAEFVGGEPIKFIGLALSGRTLDFARTGEAWPGWQAVHGMHYLLNSLHLPSEVLLDNQLSDENELRKYPIVVLSDIQCLCDAAADALERYVREGGILLITGETGLRDEWGQLRDNGVLDKIFGVVSRTTEQGPCILTEIDESLKGDSLPETYLISGEARLVHAPQAVTLATGRLEIPRKIWDTNSKPVDGNNRSAIIERQVGKGWAIFLGCNVGEGYAVNPNKRSREVLRRLLLRHANKPFEVTAPPNVVVTGWRQDDGIVFHVLNQPATLCQLVGENHVQWPEDVVPTGPITICLPGTCSSAVCPTGGTIRTDTSNEKVHITLTSLTRHEIILVLNDE